MSAGLLRPLPGELLRPCSLDDRSRALPGRFELSRLWTRRNRPSYAHVRHSRGRKLQHCRSAHLGDPCPRRNGAGHRSNALRARSCVHCLIRSARAGEVSRNRGTSAGYGDRSYPPWRRPLGLAFGLGNTLRQFIKHVQPIGCWFHRGLDRLRSELVGKFLRCRFFLLDLEHRIGDAGFIRHGARSVLNGSAGHRMVGAAVSQAPTSPGSELAIGPLAAPSD